MWGSSPALETDRLSVSLWRDIRDCLHWEPPFFTKYQQYPVSPAANGLSVWLLTRSYNSTSCLKRNTLLTHPRPDVMFTLVFCHWWSVWQLENNRHLFLWQPLTVTGSSGISHESILKLVFHIETTLLTLSAHHESCCLKRTEVQKKRCLCFSFLLLSWLIISCKIAYFCKPQITKHTRSNLKLQVDSIKKPFKHAQMQCLTNL